MTPEERRAAEWDCQKVIIDFFRHLDERRHDALSRLFHPQGLWLRQGKELRSRKQVVEVLDARPTSLLIHHLVTNIQIEVSEGTATLNCYLLVVRDEEGAMKPKPLPLRAQGIYCCTGELERTQEGWQIKHLVAGTPTFQVG